MGLLVSPTEPNCLVDALNLNSCGVCGSTQRVLSGLPRQVEDRSEPHSDQAAPPEAPRTGRDAPRTPCFEVHAVDATLHDTSYALRNYTVFGRFRFVEDDDLEDDDRGFR